VFSRRSKTRPVIASLAAALAVAGLALLGAGCKQRVESEAGAKQSGVVRLAILPVDDQRSGGAEVWPARVLPIALARQLSSVPNLVARVAGSVPDALNAGATHLVHGRLVGEGAAVRLVMDIEVVQGGIIERARAAPAGEGKWLAGAQAAARILAEKAGLKSVKLADVGVRGEATLAELGAALTADGTEEPLKLLAGAVQSEPGCGWCWEALAETAIRAGRRDEALSAFERGRKAQGVDDTSKARLEFMQAGMTGDQAMRAEALVKLAVLTPANVEVLTELAAVATRKRRWSDAMQAWKRILAIDPGSPDALNQLGYMEAWQGRFDEAVKWHKAYVSAQPASANPEDSLGEVLLMAGRFEEAEKAFVSSFEKGPEFNAGAAMEKAALACWLRGDETGARARLEAFLKSRVERGDLLVDWRRARWFYITGKTEEAKQLLQRSRASGPPPVQAFALASLALWSAEAGDRAAAAKYAAGVAAISHPAAKQILPLVSAIAGGSAAGRSDPLTAGIAALIAGDDAGAVTLLKQAMEAATPGGESQARELLAWAYVRTGNAAAAAELLRAGWPIPSSLEGQLTDFLIYPNLLYVRAKAAEHNKDAAGAAKNFEAYIKYLGSRPDARRQKEVSLKAVRL
jgi:tetratricopeptide (TPR) repeat protein